MKKKADVFTIILRSVVFAVFLGVSVFVFWLYRNDLKEAENYRENGGQTTATVTKARNYVEERTSGGGRNGRATTITESYSDFTIKYTVDGEEYGRKFERYRDRTYKKGETVTVYYLNSDPGGHIRLYLEPPPLKYIIFGVTPLIIGLIFITPGIIGHIRSKRQQKINFDNA